MSSASRLYPKKPKAPVVRVTYSLTAANGNYLKTQDSKNITVRY
jgi:hypothetical protein